MAPYVKITFCKILLLGLLINLSACKKEGFGGDSIIYGKISCDCEHSISKVYINFGGKKDNFPNADNLSESDYNFNSDENGIFLLDELVPGDYYIYVQYEDSNKVSYEGKEYVKVSNMGSNNTNILLSEI